jgi:hypothetical protein
MAQDREENATMGHPVPQNCKLDFLLRPTRKPDCPGIKVLVQRRVALAFIDVDVPQ